ncbi:MAG: acetyl-CoA hydrolase [Acidimicrobiia bacterium]|nr:acetyl-CoA hydrolase [Acidimicrobiia bacterium]
MPATQWARSVSGAWSGRRRASGLASLSVTGGRPPAAGPRVELDPLPPGRTRPGRRASLSEAFDAIPSGARVYIAPTCGLPVTLVDGLTEARDRWRALELVTDYLIGALSPFGAPGAPFTLTSLQPTPAVEPMRKAGALRSVSASYSQFARLLSPQGPLPVDVALVQVSPPGPDGRFSLGVSGGVTTEIVRTAALVIAEVNPAMPYTFGATECDRSAFDLLVEVEHPLVELAVPRPDETARAIGAHAAAQVVDGATLQFGIGAIPESVLAQLGDRSDLGLHGGMVGDTVVDLVEAGVLTGRRKSLDPGLLVVAGVIGTRRAFDWVHRNPQVCTVSSAYSHGVPVLARQARFTAINSALEVALDGSVNAEVAGDRVLSGPGGQPDFALGADLAPEGCGVVALPSVAAGGTLSRIVRQLAAGTPTTVARYLVDRVVTEYGVARLRGRSGEERAEALTAIAHPDHRAGLG